MRVIHRIIRNNDGSTTLTMTLFQLVKFSNHLRALRELCG